MAENLARVGGLQFEVLEFDGEDARAAGQLRASLAAAGTPNTGEFKRVPGLQIEDWTS